MLVRRLVSGVLCLLFFCLCAPVMGCSPHVGVVINEVVSSNRSSYTADGLEGADWIELYNAGSSAVRLLDYILTDNADSPDIGCILPDLTIPAGGYCVLSADPSAGDAAGVFCLPFGISKDGETLYLLDPSGQLVCDLTVPALGEDISYARYSDGTYGYCLRPTPNAANTSSIVAELPASPGGQARSDVPLRISEVVSGNGQAEPYACCDWMELYNPSDADVAVGGFHLSDQESDLCKASVSPLTVPARGYAVVVCTKTPEKVACASAAIHISSDGETLYLSDMEGLLIDCVTVPALPKNASWALDADGQYGYCGVATPGRENRNVRTGQSGYADMDADEPVRISEVLPDNAYSVIDAYGDHSDFVELYNSDSAPVSLLGYYLSDAEEDLTRWAFPDVDIGAGAYLLVFLSGRNTAEAELHANFSLSSEDDGCFLYRAETFSVDRIGIPADLSENVSIGRAADGSPVYYAYPTPRFPNARAFSQPDTLACYPADDVHISEVCAIGDADGDWIELYNPTDRDLDLDGWYLSDDPDDPTRCRLAGLTVQAGGYAVWEAASQADAFRISAGGETVLLTDPNGITRDVFQTGALSAGVTSGRVCGQPSVARVFFASPTKGRENSAVYTTGQTSAPVFSDTTLYHDGPFLLSLACDEPDASIRYTLDGSEPDAGSSLYREPLSVAESMTVRATAFVEGKQASAVQTAHFLLQEAHTLPVVCLALDARQWRLLNDVPYAEDGYLERCAHLTYYEADGTLGTAFFAGVRPRGNASIGYPQKSLSVHLRARYGQGEVIYPFWDGDAGAYATLILRNGSQDINGARLRDSFANRAATGMTLDCAQTRPVIVYVNGAYYGIMDLNEGMNQDYLVTRFGVGADTVNIVARNDSVKRGSADDYLRVRRYARTADFTSDATLTAFSQWVDIPYVTDYLIAQTFFGNYDIHNQNYWSTDDYTIRWRPYLYDVDRCLASASVSARMFGMYFNADGVVHNQHGDKVNMDIYCALRKNASWCDAFLNRYAELLCTGFSVETLSQLLDTMADELRPEMAAHIERFGMPASLQQWESNVSELRANIAGRHATIQKQLRAEFDLTEAEWAQRMAAYGG